MLDQTCRHFKILCRLGSETEVWSTKYSSNLFCELALYDTKKNLDNESFQLSRRWRNTKMRTWICGDCMQLRSVGCSINDVSSRYHLNCTKHRHPDSIVSSSAQHISIVRCLRIKVNSRGWETDESDNSDKFVKKTAIMFICDFPQTPCRIQVKVATGRPCIAPRQRPVHFPPVNISAIEETRSASTSNRFRIGQKRTNERR